jgi:hypothetical protein
LWNLLQLQKKYAILQVTLPHRKTNLQLMKNKYKIGIFVLAAAALITTLYFINTKKSEPEDDYLWIMW